MDGKLVKVINRKPAIRH